MKYMVKVLILSLIFVISTAQGETIKVGFYSYPPMMIEQGKSGIYQDILNEVSKISGIKFDIKYYPYARVAYLFNLGAIDIEPGVFPGWVQNQKVPGVFSVPFGMIKDVLVFGTGKKIKVSKVTDLKGKTIGLVRGYSYPNLKKMIEAKELTRIDGVDEAQLLEMLSYGRFDQILISKAVAQYNIHENEKYRKFEVGDELGNYEITLRIHPDKKEILEKVNAALLKMLKAGTISKIYLKYRITM